MIINRFFHNITNVYTNVIQDIHMMTDTAKFTLRIDTEILKKFRYVANYNTCFANRELEVLTKNILYTIR